MKAQKTLWLCIKFVLKNKISMKENGDMRKRDVESWICITN